MPKPNFSRLWKNYPSDQNGTVDETPCDDQKPDSTLRWTNQCAIRMSITLNAEGTIKVNRSSHALGSDDRILQFNYPYDERL